MGIATSPMATSAWSTGSSKNPATKDLSRLHMVFTCIGLYMGLVWFIGFHAVLSRSYAVSRVLYFCTDATKDVEIPTLHPFDFAICIRIRITMALKTGVFGLPKLPPSQYVHSSVGASKILVCHTTHRAVLRSCSCCNLQSPGSPCTLRSCGSCNLLSIRSPAPLCLLQPTRCCTVGLEIVRYRML